MTYNPSSLVALGRFWIAQGGVNLGVVGNAAHTKGYHLGKDRIYDGYGPGIGDADYSVQLARDKAGLTNAASAIDLGRLDGSLKGLQKFSIWLVNRCKYEPTKYRDIREIIYSPDGVAVKRWDNVAKVLYTGGDGTGQGDNSHRTHTHISLPRDSEARDKIAMFAGYFAVAPAAPTGDTFVSYPVPKLPTIGDVAVGVRLYADVSLVANNDPVGGDIIIDPKRSMPYFGQPTAAAKVVEYVDASGVHTGKAYFVQSAQLTNIRASETIATAAALKAAVDAAVAAAVAPVEDARLAAVRMRDAAEGALTEALGDVVDATAAATAALAARDAALAEIAPVTGALVALDAFRLRHVA